MKIIKYFLLLDVYKILLAHAYMRSNIVRKINKFIHDLGIEFISYCLWNFCVTLWACWKRKKEEDGTLHHFTLDTGAQASCTSLESLDIIVNLYKKIWWWRNCSFFFFFFVENYKCELIWWVYGIIVFHVKWCLRA